MLARACCTSRQKNSRLCRKYATCRIADGIWAVMCRRLWAHMGTKMRSCGSSSFRAGSKRGNPMAMFIGAQQGLCMIHMHLCRSVRH